MAETPVPLSTLRDQTKPQQNKLTNWNKEPTMAELQRDFTAAKPITDDHIADVQRYRDNMHITGKARVKARKGRSSVQPRLIRQQAEWRYSSLSESILSAEQIFSVRPRTFEDTKAAQQHELLLNFQFDRYFNPVQLIDTAIRKFVDYGTLALRLGWFQKTEEYEEDVPVFSFYQTTPEESPEVAEAINASGEDPSVLETMGQALREAVEYYDANGVMVYAVQTGMERVKKTRFLQNNPTLEVVDSQNLYIDPTCNGRWWEARFMVYTFESSYADLLADGRYINLDNVNWENIQTTTHQGPVRPTPGEANFTDKERRRVPVREYFGLWDIHGTGELVPIVAAWVENVCIRMEENPFPDKAPPFVLVPYMPKENSPFGQPDGELLEDNQRIIGATTRSMIDLLGRSANGQTGTAKQFLDTPNRAKFDSGEDYEYNPTMKPSEHVFQHALPNIPASAFQMINHFQLDSESITGVKAFHQGLSSSSYGDVAAGTRGVMDAAAGRETSIIRRLRMALAIVARKISEMNKVFLSKEEVVRIINDKDVVVYRADLIGQVDFKILIESAAENELRVRDLGFVLQTLGPTVPFGLTKMALGELIRLKKMPELAKRVEAYEPEPDPLDQQLKQLEIQKLQSEIQKNMAQAAHYQAQTRLNGSEADLKDQEFADTQSGVKHARAKDMAGAQADANQNLTITKGLTDVAQETGDFLPAVAHAALTRQQ